MYKCNLFDYLILWVENFDILIVLILYKYNLFDYFLFGLKILGYKNKIKVMMECFF